MLRFFSSLALIASFSLIGCGPAPITEEAAADAPRPAEPARVEAPAPAPIASMPESGDDETVAETKDFIVLNEPWNAYFRSDPKILLLPKLSKGIADILEEEQNLIKAVLDSGGQSTTSSEYVALQDRMEELKSIIPQTTTSSGYVERRSRYGRRSYISEDTVYINRPYYYDGYYSALREKTASSSPAMTRSVEGIAHNATLEDIEQRIDALRQVYRKWSRETSEMNANGTSGIMRRANEAYLDGLQEYTQAFVEIQSELREVERRQQAIKDRRSEILVDWKQFEETRLPILDDYVRSNAAAIFSPTAEDTFPLPDFAGKHLIYACEIGERTLFFELEAERQSEVHPFVLVNVNPVR